MVSLALDTEEAPQGEFSSISVDVSKADHERERPCYTRYGSATSESGKRGPALSLVQRRSLALTFVGAGSAFSKKYFQNNLLIVKGDAHLLVDCGTRTPEALALLGLSVAQIKQLPHHPQPRGPYRRARGSHARRPLRPTPQTTW